MFVQAISPPSVAKEAEEEKNSHLKGIRVKMQGDLKNVQIFASAGFIWWLCQYLCNRSTFLLQVVASQGTAMLLLFSLWTKGSKMLAHNVSYISSTHAGLVHDITHTHYALLKTIAFTAMFS